jgi:hypothetical protein
VTPKFKPIGPVLANDGEVAVFLPLRSRGGDVKDYSHAQTMRRGETTEKKFREVEYCMMDGAEAYKAEMLNTLNIIENEFQGAMRLARSDVAESRSFMKLVRAYRASAR